MASGSPPEFHVPLENIRASQLPILDDPKTFEWINEQLYNVFCHDDRWLSFKLP